MQVTICVEERAQYFVFGWPLISRMNLKNLARLNFRFAPLEGNCKSIREFLSRCTTAKATASNTECQVDVKVRARGDPSVEVVFAGGASEKIKTKDMKVSEILERIERITEEMETRSILKEAGQKEGEKLQSDW